MYNLEFPLYQGSKGKFTFSVFPSTANTYEFITESDIIELSKDGNFEAKQIGQAEVKIKYLTAENAEYSYKNFIVTIVECVDDFDANISSINGDVVDYCLKENKYKITISSIENLKANMLYFSENVIVEKVEISNNSAIVDIQIVETGNVSIAIKVTLDQYTTLSKSIIVDVYSYDDIEVFAKWLMYEQKLFDDGKYHIYLNGGSGIANSLTFSLMIGDQTLTENYKIYNIVDGGRILCYDSSTSSKLYKFSPTETGEYVFEFKIGDVVVEMTRVVVSYFM